MNVPSHYPLMLENADELYQILLENKIYCPRFWPGLLDLMRGAKCEVERAFGAKIIPLIIDQRYGTADMKKIVRAVRRVIF